MLVYIRPNLSSLYSFFGASAAASPCGATFRSSLFARPFASFAASVWPSATPSTSLGLRALCALQAAPPFGRRRAEHLF